MDLINNSVELKYQNMLDDQIQENQVQESSADLENKAQNSSDEELKEAIADFTSVFLQQMFSTMRDTVPDNDLIDGGFGEDVFTGMLDEEISKMGSQQNTFKQLNELMFEQLSGRR